jgi:hypothetical protein
MSYPFTILWQAYVSSVFEQIKSLIAMNYLHKSHVPPSLSLFIFCYSLFFLFNDAVQTVRGNIVKNEKLNDVGG